MPGPTHMLYPHRSAPSPFHPAPVMARRAVPPSSRSATSSPTLLLAATALFVLAGCSAAQGAIRADADPWGNVYPIECRGELPDLRVFEVSQGFLDRATGAKNRVGVWTPRGVAYVLRGLSPAMRAAVEKHERCHQAMFELTGDPRWHGGDNAN